MKILIEGVIEDLVADFLYYDRKDDEDLRVGDIERAIKDKIITEKQIIEQFAEALKNGLTNE